jgi:uncharacterized protein RhaS with RHS repeats
VRYYGFRYYSPSFGRFLSRDPVGDAGGDNPYAFTVNNCINRIDILGLWDTDLHKWITTGWASYLGFRSEGADAIGENDEKVDGHGWFGFWSEIGGTGPMPWQDQRYHFNRDLSGGPDTRLDLSDEHFVAALLLCRWVGGSGKDKEQFAAEAMGGALHPLQDWVAHADYGLRNTGVIWVPHNSGGDPITGDSGAVSKYPDRLDLDAIGGDSDGRAVVASFIYTPAVGTPATETAKYKYGTKRFSKTQQLTMNRLQVFLDSVRNNAKPCGQCRAFFLKDSDPRRYK